MKKRKLPVCLFFGSLLIVLGFFFLKNMETIQAKPDDGNPIVIDKGTVDEFSLPFDAKKLLESDLLAQSPQYDAFVQENKVTPTLIKQRDSSQQIPTYLWSSQIKNSIVNTYITSYGNIISLQKFTTFPYNVPYNKIEANKVILQSPTGEVLDSKWVYQSPNSIQQPSNTTESSKAYLYELSPSNYTVTFATSSSHTNTTSYSDDDGKLLVSKDDENSEIPLPTTSLGQKESEHDYQSIGLTSDGDRNIVSASTIKNITADKNNYYGFAYLSGEINNLYAPDNFNLRTDPDKANAITTKEHYSRIKQGSLKWISEGNSVISGTELFAIEEQNTAVGTFNNIIRYRSRAIVGPDAFFRDYVFEFENSTVDVESALNSRKPSDYYIQVRSQENVKLCKVDTSLVELLELPKNTNVKFDFYEDGYVFIGHISNFTGIFKDVKGGPGIYAGILDKDFKLTSIFKPIDLNFTGDSSEILLTNLRQQPSNEFVISGMVQTEEINFIDDVIYGNYPGETSSLENKKWITQELSPLKGNSFVSYLKLEEDWAPIIKAPDSFMIDISDSDLKTGNPSILDNWLLTGSKNGTLEDSSAVSVFDRFDQTLKGDGYSQIWLNKRINKNPLKESNSIDWEALGLNLESVGPQQITYFISDSANQVTTTSQWINKKDDFTALDDDHALYAKNFSVPLASVQTDLASIDEVKKRAETKAWNLTNFEIKEDGTKNLFSDRVIIDETQLSSLQQAKDAKPYPLDITYQTENGKITRRIWVFVTAENTTVDTENNIVLYANDYRYPLDQAPTTTVEKQLREQWDNTEPAVKAYEYNAIQETGQTLIPLSDGALEGTSCGLGMEQLDLERIQGATEPSVLADIHFTYITGEKKVSVAVDVTLYHAQTSVVVNFEDTDQTVVHPQVTIEGNVNSQIDLTSKEVVTDALSEIVAEGYLLKERPENEMDILLTAEKKEVTYLFEGQLQFIHVTDSLKLTKGKILPFAQTLKYDNPAEDFTVQVKDTRSYKNQTEKTRGTFKVNVSLTKEFESIDGKKLSEAALLYKNQEITDSGLDVTRSKQNPLNPEEKDFSFLLNQKGTGTEGFTLEVPAGIAQTKAYYAEMTWDLIEGP
ncbi:MULTISPECIES: MucBP domain-containing protein [unclassified Enterococcus]|uniref:MucBP domain-containing protein n=1 Tax=unclassified Enterococcus TaxID=2608891 RepID=UPI001CE0787D|nr:MULTISPECIES: MucBP domain-containing protein [unclassified Enterococcus]MCA5011473.1 hypothetical protein [Enterococcus sp. S23]MCA5015085.1 hypothetical protein [Enterococcus sp. S22(2020)]